MKYEITAACGHTVTVDIYGSAAERERKVKWYENNYICDECRNAENAEGCEEVEMSYAEYKTSYSDCKTKKDSYNKKTKTIIVYVPVAAEEVTEEKETAESTETVYHGSTTVTVEGTKYNVWNDTAIGTFAQPIRYPLESAKKISGKHLVKDLFENPDYYTTGIADDENIIKAIKITYKIQ